LEPRQKVDEPRGWIRDVAGPELLVAERITVALFDQAGIELSGFVIAQFEHHRGGLGGFVSEPRQAEPTDDIGVAGAVDQLSADDSAFRFSPHQFQFVAVFDRPHDARHFIVAEPPTSLQERLLQKGRIERPIDADLVFRVSLRRL
jgi:hypothetical protein